MKVDQFRVLEGAKFSLKKVKTDSTGAYKEKKDAQKDLEKNVVRLGKLQDILYAQNIHALLVVIQAMDAAGKDSVIKHVMTGVNPQGCSVVAYKAPSAEEKDHDFLWRNMKNVPERGRIGIFNRSHYEEVLVVRVHPEFLAAQQIPENVKKDKDIWKKRYEQIRQWETYLAQNGVHTLKFFLYVSKEAQKKRFLERIDSPEKNWKFSAADLKERQLWDDYMKAYEDAIEATSTELAPWYVIPADKKWFTRVAVSEIICQKLESLKLEYPKLSKAQTEELAQCKKALESEPDTQN